MKSMSTNQFCHNWCSWLSENPKTFKNNYLKSFVVIFVKTTGVLHSRTRCLNFLRISLPEKVSPLKAKVIKTVILHVYKENNKNNEITSVEQQQRCPGVFNVKFEVISNSIQRIGFVLQTPISTLVLCFKHQSACWFCVSNTNQHNGFVFFL